MRVYGKVTGFDRDHTGGRSVCVSALHVDVPRRVHRGWTLIAAVCPGLVDTRASRPWFDDYSHAQTPEQAARAVLDLILAGRLDPATYGELVQFGQVLPWHSGTPSNRQDQILSR